MRPTFEKPNARTSGPAWGAALDLLAALGFSLKATFVKRAYPTLTMLFGAATVMFGLSTHFGLSLLALAVTDARTASAS